MSIYRWSKTSLIIFKNHVFKFFFWVLTVSSKGGVLCSAIVSEQLKMRKLLRIHDCQDIISGIEVNNNVININKLWRVSTIFWNFLLFFTLTLFFFFFNLSKTEVSKNMGREGRGTLQPPGFYRPDLISIIALAIIL